MTIPAGFQFSQASLQDFHACRRRFQLRYLENQAWPALQAEPALEFERLARLGARYHHMIHQHQLGLPDKQIIAPGADPALLRWWDHYLDFSTELAGYNHPQAARYPEVSLSAPLGNFRLVAKFDLLVILPDGRAAIFDWKTARRRPRPGELARRMQSRVYPSLLVQAGAVFNHGQSIPPAALEMIYWFSEFPDQPERLAYNPNQFEADHEYLTGLVEDIASLSPTEFNLTLDQQRCSYCVYRSLCERGAQAGPLDELDDYAEPEAQTSGEFDFDQIGEISF